MSKAARPKSHTASNGAFKRPGHQGDNMKLIHFIGPMIVAAAGLIESATAADISQQALISIGTQALAYKPADQFSAPFSAADLSGKSIDVTIPIIEQLLDPVMPPGVWSYDPNREELTVAITNDHFSIADGRPAGFVLQSTKRLVGKDIEQNAFGAKVAVKHYEVEQIGIASISAPAISGTIKFDAPFDTLKATIKLGADAARIATKSLTLRIRGTVLPLANGNSIECGLDGVGATFDSPTAGIFHNCLFNTQIVSLELLANGQQIASWDSSYRAVTGMEADEQRFQDHLKHLTAPRP
jgi:hypothetical protein